MINKTYINLIESLKNSGHRVTPQRKAICRVLSESDSHPSAQMIFEQLREEDSSLSLATVYNTLDALTRLGMICELGEFGEQDAVRYDADISPHINLACVNCQRIVDVPSQQVHELVAEIANKSGYTLIGARVLYYGICPECQASNPAARQP